MKALLTMAPIAAEAVCDARMGSEDSGNPCFLGFPKLFATLSQAFVKVTKTFA
jgi:hypothetical protein